MSTTDSDFFPSEIENLTPESVTSMLTKMIKIIKEDKKGNEERFAQIQDSIDKRMENFVNKFKGSQKDESSSVKTSSNPTKDEGESIKPSYEQSKLREASNEEGSFSDISRDSDEKILLHEDVLQPRVEDPHHDIKQGQACRNQEEDYRVCSTVRYDSSPQLEGQYDQSL